MQLFNELRGTWEQTTVTRSCNGRGGCATNTERTMYLANGTQVHHAEDLLPVVAPDSAAAASVHAAQRSASSRRTYVMVALAGLLVAVVAGHQAFSSDEDVGGGTKLALYGGGAVFVVGAIGSYYYGQEADMAHDDAIHQYNEGLAKQLRVCVDGLRVVPCEDATSPTEPAPPGGT